MNNTAAILLPSGLRRIVDNAIDAAWLGVRGFRRGGGYANAPVGQAATLLNRLLRILRWAFVILAVHLDLPPSRARPARGRGARSWRPRRPAFPLFARYRIVYDNTPKGAFPAAFARAAQTPRDRFLTAQRKLDALTRALADPMPFIRRMARRLPTQLMVFGWRPPKRPPLTDRRDFFEDLIAVFREAKFALSEWRRRRRDIEAAEASGS